ncbi:hypothetical protein LOC67_00370 [Stieleria sp. JC731]|nr:hypothetical protein [Stieleria sp. JC731]
MHDEPVSPSINKRLSYSANTWVYRLAIVYIVLSMLAIFYLVWLLIQLPVPRQFEIESDRQDAIFLVGQVLEDLRDHPHLRLFGDKDYEFIQFLGEELEQMNDAAKIQKQCEFVLQLYQGEFTEYRLSVKYLLTSAVTGAFIALLVSLRPSIWAACLLEFVSLAGTALNSELFAGRDFSHLFVFTLPHLMLGIAILGFAMTGYWANKFETQPRQREPWTLVWFGAAGLVVAIAMTYWEITSQSRSTLRTTQGLGAVFVAAGWSLFAGTKQLLQLKSTKGDHSDSPSDG